MSVRKGGKVDVKMRLGCYRNGGANTRKER
jgi:hypothetical protein